MSGSPATARRRFVLVDSSAFFALIERREGRHVTTIPAGRFTAHCRGLWVG